MGHEKRLTTFHSVSFHVSFVVFYVNLFVLSGYLFSPDITAAMESYTNDVADCVIEKAKRMCKDLHNVSILISYNDFDN